MAFPARSFSQRQPVVEAVPSAVKWLLVLNSLIFILSYHGRFIDAEDIRNFALNPPAVVRSLALWQILTYMFLHTETWHWVFNALGLFVFGSMLERMLGTGKFVRFYLVCGAGAGIACILGTLRIGRAPQFTLGASGAVFGLIAGAGILLGDSRIVPGLPLNARHFSLLAGGIVLLNGFDDPSSGFIHAGGAITGLALALASRRTAKILREPCQKP